MPTKTDTKPPKKFGATVTDGPSGRNIAKVRRGGIGGKARGSNR